ncbi:MAG: phosphoglycerate dehydrogenase [Lysobacterales bacterium]
MFRIRTFNAISPNGLSRLPEEHYQIDDQGDDPHGVLVRSADLHGQNFGPSLLAVARAGAGTNNIPIPALSERGVVVFNAPGANANAVKELVLAGMLMSMRNLAEAAAYVGGLDPQDAELEKRVEGGKKKFVGQELIGRTLGVVGLGAIGVKVANAAKAMGMRVLGFDPHMTIEGAWQLSSEVDKAGSLNELYAQADFISFHVPLNPATRGLFAAASLAVAKPGVVLLNFAREGVVDAEALHNGLQSGRIQRYVSDFPRADLIGHPRVLAFPHLGASTHEAEENCAVMVVDQLREFLEHGNIVNAVNFPSMRLARAGHQRICIANKNKPNMIGQLTHVIGESEVNITQMHNASRGDFAYNIVDVDAAVGENLVTALRAIDGILSVRVI